MKKKNRNWFCNLAAAFRRAAGARRKIQNRHTKGGRMGWRLQGLGGGAKKKKRTERSTATAGRRRPGYLSYGNRPKMIDRINMKMIDRECS
jgi:hypothetical protein